MVLAVVGHVLPHALLPAPRRWITVESRVKSLETSRSVPLEDASTSGTPSDSHVIEAPG